MSPDLSDPSVLSNVVRRHIINGPALRCAIGFGVLGVSSVIMLLVLILNSYDMLIGFGHYSQKFNYLIHTEPAALVGWLGRVASGFDDERGHAFASVPAWMVLVVILGLLFVAHFNRFSRPRGVSLLHNPKARGAVQDLLSAFGHFQDIKIPIGKDGTLGKSFFATGTVLFAPRGQVSQILKGKRAANQRRAVLFFMAHEYAHMVTKDNWAHSIFLVSISIYVFAFQCLFGNGILFSSLLLMRAPGIGPVMSGFLGLLLFMLFCGGVALCFYGLLVSYIKAREFFADDAAFRVAPELTNPYGVGSGALRSDMWSAFSRNMAGYERQMHQQGYSLHARNLLIFFWGFVVALRTWFILVAPKDLCIWVLAFDGAALCSFALLARNLPPRPAKPIQQPRLPWLVTLTAILAVLATGPGLMGAVERVVPTVLSDMNAGLMTMPVVLVFLPFVLTALFKLATMLWTIRGREPRRSGKALWRLVLWLLTVPGWGVAYLLMFVLILSFSVPMLWQFLSLRFIGADLGTNLLAVALLLVSSLFLYLQYQTLFVPVRWRVLAMSLLEALLAGAILCATHLAIIDFLAAAEQKVIRPMISVDSLMELFRTSDLSSSLIVGAISALCYLLLRSVAFFAQSRLDQIERTLELVTYR